MPDASNPKSSSIRSKLNNNQSETKRFIFRVLILGSILIGLNCYVIISSENRIVWQLTAFSIFPTVLFTLFILSGINLFLKRNDSKLALRNSEIAVLYIMISVSTTLAGQDLIRQLVPLMANPFWYATLENEWEELFFHYLPTWLTVPNKQILQGYFEGNGNFWQLENINAWWLPILIWTIFVIVILFVMLCINIIVRKQWTEHERLRYPLTIMPTEIIRDTTKLFSNKLIWLGFGIAFGIELINGLNYLNPALPAIKVKSMVRFQGLPWSNAGQIPIGIYPFAIGLGYLIPLDLSFSLWCFYIVWRMQRVILKAFGLNSTRWLTHTMRGGAWIAIGTIALWTCRRHIISVLGVFFSRKEEDKLYNFAIIGLTIGMLMITLFWYQAGLSPWVAISYFGIYFVLCTGMTRMRAETGPPTHELQSTHPDRILGAFVGSRSLGVQNLTNTTLLSWLAYGYRCHPMPNQLEGLKIGSNFNISRHKLIIAMILASVVGAFLSILLHVSLYYKFPFNGTQGIGEFHHLRNQVIYPQDTNLTMIRHLGTGFLITIIIAILKHSFLWWPLYPMGYAISDGWAFGWMWFSIFLAWAAKRSIFALGGLKYNRIMLPFFLGLIFGQFSAGSLWSLIGIALGTSVYTMFP